MTDERSTAYRLGQLLARLDRAGVVRQAERAYEQAVTRPAAMIPWITEAQRKRKGLLIAQIMERLPADALSTSRTLTVDEQGDFSLGYFHERAENPNAPR